MAHHVLVSEVHLTGWGDVLVVQAHAVQVWGCEESWLRTRHKADVKVSIACSFSRCFYSAMARRDRRTPGAHRPVTWHVQHHATKRPWPKQLGEWGPEVVLWLSMLAMACACSQTDESINTARTHTKIFLMCTWLRLLALGEGTVKIKYPKCLVWGKKNRFQKSKLMSLGRTGSVFKFFDWVQEKLECSFQKASSSNNYRYNNWPGWWRIQRHITMGHLGG